MKEILIWLGAVLLIGVVLAAVEKLISLQGAFATAFRLIAGVLALLCFGMFVYAILKYLHVA